MISLPPVLIPPLYNSQSQIPHLSSIGKSLHSSKHAIYSKTQFISSNFLDYSCKFSPNNGSVSDLIDTQLLDEDPVAEFSGFDQKEHWVDPFWLVSVLKSRYRLVQVKAVHAVILKSLKNSIVSVYNNLISVYLGFGKLAEARKVFDEMPERSVVSWTAMLTGYLTFGLEDEGYSLVSEFVKSGIRANGMTFVCILNLCGKRVDYELGRQVHACIVKGRWSNLIVDSAVLYFYSQCGDLLTAFRVFDRMRERDVVTWTTMITSCSQQGFGKEAFSLFSQMLVDGYLPNEHTVCSILKACGDEKTLKFGRQLHGIVVKKLIKNDVFIGTSLVGMYARCGEMEDSRQVFDKMKKRNMVTWTSIVNGYARNGIGHEALKLFRLMRRRKVVANNLTIVSTLRACGSIRALLTGKEIHAQVLKLSAQNNIYVGSTLVWLYCKCGEYALASKVLQEMPLRDVVSWTAIISGCTHLGYDFEALEFLKEMLGEGVEPNPFTYSSVLKACAKLEAVQHGKLIHSSVNKSPVFSNNIFVGSALINMYAKCGYVSEAFRVFSSMPEKNLVSWRSMIVGYARNGFCHEALKLMYLMQAEGIKDDYIITTVLSACGDVEWNLEPSSQPCLQPN